MEVKVVVTLLVMVVGVAAAVVVEDGENGRGGIARAVMGTVVVMIGDVENGGDVISAVMGMAAAAVW